MDAPIKDRVSEAESAWANALALEHLGQLDAAYIKFTQAHDLVIDCPKMHWRSHQHLARINWKRKNIREFIEDRLLLSAAPFGIFVLIAYLLKKNVIREEFCIGTPSA
ncbi:MAG: hypothetical protein Q7U28_06460 [Aquabacterium sp.]|nr:hypothetical protein [Aquabacterium sp.]